MVTAGSCAERRSEASGCRRLGALPLQIPFFGSIFTLFSMRFMRPSVEATDGSLYPFSATAIDLVVYHIFSTGRLGLTPSLFLCQCS
jgi:hypothetical protein